jgi:hypothetical protein
MTSPSILPDDKLEPVPGIRLHPTTCQVTNSFVP